MQSSSKRSDGREELIRAARSISMRTGRKKGLGRGMAKAEMALGISTRRYLGCSGSSPLLRGSAAAPPAPGAHKPQGWVCARTGFSGSLDLTRARSLPPGPSFTAPPCPAGVMQEGRPRRRVWGRSRGSAGLARSQAAPGAPGRAGGRELPARDGFQLEKSKVTCWGQVRSRCYGCRGLCLPLHPPGSSSPCPALSHGTVGAAGQMGTVLSKPRP